MEIISGEKFKQICEINIMHPKNHTTNINGKKIIPYPDFKKEVSNINLFSFCTHLISEKDFIDKLKLITCDFSIIFHNSDYHFKEEHLQFFDKIPNLKKIYTQNCEVEDEKVIPIPIGIANSQWPHGNLDILNRVLNENIKKDKDIYFNFSMWTNKKERSYCRKKIARKGVRWLKSMDYLEYLKLLKSYRFAISPPGNGVDCHRIWECLYMKTIPICKKSFLTEHFSKLFPIVTVDD